MTATVASVISKVVVLRVAVAVTLLMSAVLHSAAAAEEQLHLSHPEAGRHHRRRRRHRRHLHLPPAQHLPICDAQTPALACALAAHVIPADTPAFNATAFFRYVRADVPLVLRASAERSAASAATWGATASASLLADLLGHRQPLWAYLRVLPRVVASAWAWAGDLFSTRHRVPVYAPQLPCPPGLPPPPSFAADALGWESAMCYLWIGQQLPPADLLPPSGMSSSFPRTTLHYDAVVNVYTQLAGVKRFRLLPPHLRRVLKPHLNQGRVMQSWARRMAIGRETRFYRPREIRPMTLAATAAGAKNPVVVALAGDETDIDVGSDGGGDDEGGEAHLFQAFGEDSEHEWDEAGGQNSLEEDDNDDDERRRSVVVDDAFLAARAIEVVLRPGDRLVLPPFWFHEVESFGAQNVATSHWWKTGGHMARVVGRLDNYAGVELRPRSWGQPKESTLTALGQSLGSPHEFQSACPRGVATPPTVRAHEAPFPCGPAADRGAEAADVYAAGRVNADRILGGSLQSRLLRECLSAPEESCSAVLLGGPEPTSWPQILLGGFPELVEMIEGQCVSGGGARGGEGGGGVEGRLDMHMLLRMARQVLRARRGQEECDEACRADLSNVLGYDFASVREEGDDREAAERCRISWRSYASGN